MSQPDLNAIGERIDQLLDASSAGGIVARERAEELVRLVTDLYGAGIERVLDILYDAGRLDEEAIALLAADELVSGLLSVHGLHPHSVEARVEAALSSHGGDVELVAVTDDTVRVRLPGSSAGCGSADLRVTVERAIQAAAPEIEVIEVETPTTEPTTLIPVAAL
jgi:Fe-S cluster biogenesis protein NfuA